MNYQVLLSVLYVILLVLLAWPLGWWMWLVIESEPSSRRCSSQWRNSFTESAAFAPMRT